MPLTHEETFAFHAVELQSYRQLPQSWYHFQTKDRDEPRPRGGLLRVREFIMKDSYSFDRDEAGLDISFEAHRGAYERIWERCGVEAYGVQAESGMMGGSESLDYLAPSGSGENTLVTCENGDYAADLEIARGVPRAPEPPERLDAPAEIETPDTRTCEALAELLSVDLAATTKAMPVVTDDGTLVLALLRGDDRLEEAKLQSVLGTDFRPATDDEIVSGFGAEGGSLGPVGFTGRIVADETLREGQFVSGANRTGWHLRGVEAGRDYEPEFADLRQPLEGDACPVCGGRLGFQTAIEVGHIFKLGTKYSEAFGAKYLDEDGVEKPIVMGSYGIGPGRVLAAAVEQHGSEDGDRLARGDHAVRRPRGRARLGQSRARRARRGAGREPLRRGPRRPSRRPRATPRREVRRRRPDRLPAARHGRQEDARGRRRRSQGPVERRRIANYEFGPRKTGRRTLMARRRKYSEEQFGVTIERLMAETGLTYRGLAAKTGPLGRLPEPPRARQPAGPVDGGRRAPGFRARRRARALP